MSHLVRPLARLVRDFARVYAPRRLPWHLLAFALTFAIVVSGLDWTVVTTFRGTELRTAAFTAGRVGFWVPIAAPLVLLLVGFARRDERTWRNGWLLAEAELLALVICAAHKAVTGRPGPPRILVDNSGVFRWGFLEGGLFWGWPSSHVMVAVAGSVALFVLHPHSRTVRVVALVYAAYMTLCVAITFHWLSDAVAGAIIGTVIGSVVGRNERTAA